MKNLEGRLQKAVDHFWRTRQAQGKTQGGKTGRRDTGARAAVTGGAQMDGFVYLIRDLLVENGVPEAAVYCKKNIELPGWFRPEKQWDLLVILEDRLIAAIEFKSQVGPSFGNNYNNRTEESLGNATDIWAAYREGAFKPSTRPWLGYLMLLEETAASLSPVKVREPHYTVFDEFKGASYADRYRVLLTKLLRERLYDGTCLLLSVRKGSRKNPCREMSPELSFQNFVESLLAKAIAAIRTR